MNDIALITDTEVFKISISDDNEIKRNNMNLWRIISFSTQHRIGKCKEYTVSENTNRNEVLNRSITKVISTRP